MTITCEPFRAAHALELGGDEPRAVAYEHNGRAFTLKQDGRVIACAGLVGSRPACLWSLTASGVPLRSVHNAARRLLQMFRSEQIIAFTAVGNDPGCRWLELLGFSKAYSDHEYHRYVRESR